MLRKYLPFLRAPEGDGTTIPAAPAADPAAAPAAAPAAPAEPEIPGTIDPPSSATEGSPVAENPKGSASLIDEMNSMLDRPQGAPKAPERGADGKFKPGQPKPPSDPKATPPKDPKAADPKAPQDPKEPKAPPVDANTKDPVALRKRLAELETQAKKDRADREAEISTLKTKIQDYEKKKFVTPEQEAANRQREERLKELEGERAASDFRKTPEFKRDFSDPWQAEWRQGVANVKQLTVTDAATGETRAGTQKDFDTVRTAGTIVQQRAMAKALFGEDWDLVMTHVNNMTGIEQRAAQAVANHEQNYETTRQSEIATYQTEYDRTNSVLAEKYPQFFGEDPNDPEAVAEGKKGLDFIDRAIDQAKTATPLQRASANATIRQWAAAFPRMHFMLGKKDAEIASLKEQLAKYQGSDPGGDVHGGDGGPGGGAPADPNAMPVGGGSEAMAAEFDRRQL